MKQASLAHAKAHLSELVDDAEHRGKRVLIHRRGKPAAVLVPVAVGMPPERPGLTQAEVDAVFDRLAKFDDAAVSAVDDLIRGRR